MEKQMDIDLRKKFKYGHELLLLEWRLQLIVEPPI